MPADTRAGLPDIQRHIARSGMQCAARRQVGATPRSGTMKGYVAQTHHHLRHSPGEVFHDAGVGMKLPHLGMPAQRLAHHQAAYGRETKVGRFGETVIARVLWQG